MQISWGFTDSSSLLNPWKYNKELQTKAKERLIEYYKGKGTEEAERISQQIISGYGEHGRKWSNLEEVLTVTGEVPVDISKGEKYRIIDQQNQNSEMFSASTAYKVVRFCLSEMFSDDGAHYKTLRYYFLGTVFENWEEFNLEFDEEEIHMDNEQKRLKNQERECLRDCSGANAKYYLEIA